jgi:hypothetical protein
MTTDVTLETTIAALPTPVSGSQPFHPVGSNVYISRTVEGATQLVLVNALPPSQSLNLKHATLQVDVDFDFVSTLMPSLERCLVLEFDTAIDAHAIAKVAEHLTRNDTNQKNGDDLLYSLDVFRDLVEGDTFGWGFHRIVSLWGEFATLERLLSYADTPVKQHRCVQAWQAYSIHCLDFSLPGQLTSFDVKTTTQRTRSHQISSVDQLVQANTPCIYLASWMIRPVGEDEGWSVMDIVQRIRDNLAGEASALFETSLGILELDELACSNDWFMERHNRPFRLFEAQDVPGVGQFTPLPDGVPSLSWPVNLTEEGISEDDLDTLFINLLSVYDEVNPNDE